MKLELFISHSSQDREIAELLVNLAKAAFRFRAAEILCTSVEGHKLRGGADTEEELRGKVRDAGVLIGIITPASLASSYLLFELGARWGCNRPLIPLLAGGLKASDLREPLKSVNALAGKNVSDLHQLIEDIGAILGRRPEPVSSYNRHITLLANGCKAVGKHLGSSPSTEQFPIEYYVNGQKLADGVIVQVPERSPEYVSLDIAIHNASDRTINKGGLQVYVAAPAFSLIDETVLNGVPMDLATMTSGKGKQLYRLLDFPPLLPGGWESRTVGFHKPQASLEPDQSYEIELAAASEFGKQSI